MRPITQEGSSDTAILDNVVEFLMLGGRSLPHVMMMLIPEAWEKDPEISPERRAFYEYHGSIIEPWDGPASIAFTDGTLIGATLDRNGLRPSRYCLTDDNLLIMASEAGVLPVPPEKIVQKGRLQPGPHVRGLARGGPHHPRRGDQGAHLLGRALPAVARRGQDRRSPSWSRRAEILPAALASRADAPEGLRLHARGPAHPHGAHGQRRPGARRLDGQRRAPGRALGASRATSSTTSTSSSPRSATRPSTPSARSSS